MKKGKLIIALLLLLAAMVTPSATAQAATADKQPVHRFEVGKGTFLLDGKPFVVKAAEIHYPRIPEPYWEHRIKMCKALGMNTICLYIFWNYHEATEGKFNFTGDHDIARFCRLAQKEGMYVIVRPGPYVCAEWEMGGLPWWLLKKKDINLRTKDPYFMERVGIFMKEVGKQLAPLQFSRGGNILMVQVENEYGSYATDKAYVSSIRDIVRSAGFTDVPLFQCDWSSNFLNNGLDDLLWTMNFGTGADIDAQFKKLKEVRPESPLMCSEFWSGWFDHWGAPHETRPAEAMTKGIDDMLSRGISFSLYMTHGGTSFGHWAGANSPGIVPDVTSYDYDAPINEYGHTTPKYFALRDVLAKYYDGKKLPSIPKPIAPIISLPKTALSEYAPLGYGEDKTKENRDVLTFEDFDMGFGTMVYETELPETNSKTLLSLNDGHDYTLVYINGKLQGKIDRIKNEKTLEIPATHKGDRLTLVVEAMGRINFGHAIKDYKGITQSVTLTGEADGDVVTWDLKGWKMITLPDDYSVALRAFDRKREGAANNVVIDSKSGYYRGYFTLKRTGDSFLNLESWGKGQVWVNGHALGRFWQIGPQQTLYVPGCWLKKGRNEVVVLDVTGPQKAEVFGQTTPEINKVNDDSFDKGKNKIESIDLSNQKPALTGTFKNEPGWQYFKLPTVQEGSFVCIEALGNFTGSDVAAIAEFDILGADGKPISRESWSIPFADSQDTQNGNNTAEKIYDLQESTYWQTANGKKFPHTIVINLGKEASISGFRLLPRAEQNRPGQIKDFRFFIGKKMF